MSAGWKKRYAVWRRAWKSEFSSHKYLIFISLIFFILANIASFLASRYVDKITTVEVPDLILNLIPVLDLNFLFVYGFLAVIIIIISYVIFFRVKNSYKVLLQFSLLILVRSFFIILTHVGQPLEARAITGSPIFFQFLNFRNDLFFSGHAAIPFMAFLLFRKEKIGIFFLAMSIILAITVLFLHIHYSIDVFGAFFITYGTYVLGELLCNKFCY